MIYIYVTRFGKYSSLVDIALEQNFEALGYTPRVGEFHSRWCLYNFSFA